MLALITSTSQASVWDDLKYFAELGYHQARIITRRTPIDEALRNDLLNDVQKRKILLASDARQFAIEKLGLKKSSNYTKFVQLDEPYVSYVVNAAPQFEISEHLWRYPIVGKMPYKGFPHLVDAENEARKLHSENFDTFVRGVSAYSTLGWFEDPILSSMLNYSEYDLVNTIIHETVHATIYIKNHSDFNEQLAVFIGNIGAERFYLEREGANSPTLSFVKDSRDDDKLFSEFMTEEIKNLNKTYKSDVFAKLPQEEKTQKKQQLLSALQEKFKNELAPRLKTKNYEDFATRKLNNAYLQLHNTYFEDLSQFDRVYEKVGKNFTRFLEKCKSLENCDDPKKCLLTP